VRKAAAVSVRAFALRKLATGLRATLASTAVALAPAIALAAASATLRALVGTMAELTACEASTSTFAAAFATTLASAAKASAAEAFASTFARTTGASSDVRGIVLSFAVIPCFVVAQCIAFRGVLSIRALIPVHENVFTAIVLDDEPKSFLIIEELAHAGLGHRVALGGEEEQRELGCHTHTRR